MIGRVIWSNPTLAGAASRINAGPQTAAGVESDLRCCLTEWERQCRIDEFPIGEHDTPDRLLIPERLYGRESEIDALLAAFDRVVAGGKPELVIETNMGQLIMRLRSLRHI
jgi:hypothetical protein